jgi:hypothetical protein
LWQGPVAAGFDLSVVGRRSIALVNLIGDMAVQLGD